MMHYMQKRDGLEEETFEHVENNKNVYEQVKYVGKDWKT